MTTAISQTKLDNNLLDAVSDGKLEDVKELLAMNANIHCLNHLPLILAAQYGYLDIVEHLVENGANIHGQDNWGFVLSCSKGHLPVAQFLFSKLKKTLTIDDSVITALDLSVNHGNTDIVTYLFENNPHLHERIDKNNLTIQAAKNGHLEIIQFFLSHGADIYTNQNAPLIEASSNGMLEVVQYIICEYNGDYNLAIKEAVKNDKYEILNWCTKYSRQKKMHDNLTNDLNEVIITSTNKQKNKI